MTKQIQKTDSKPPMTPGIGVAGDVICPIMSIGTIGGRPCCKHACEFWVELTYGAGTKDERKVARCAIAWLPTVGAEVNGNIRRMMETLKGAVK